MAPIEGPRGVDLGVPARKGAELAIHEINRGGGLRLDDRQVLVELRVEDCGDHPEAVIEATRRLITNQSVVGLVGPILSRNALVAATVAEHHRVPMITPSATAPEVTRGREFVFRATFVDDQQGRALARFTRHHLELHRAAVLYDVASPHQRTVAETFRAAFDALGGTTVAFESHTTGERDFEAQLLRIRDAQPEILLLPNYLEEVPMQVEQARRLGIEATLLGSDAWSGDSYPSLPGFEGAYFADEWQVGVPESTSEPSNEFEQRFFDNHGEAPMSLAAASYDATRLLLSALAEAGTLDGEAIRQSLLDLPPFEGVTGTMDFVHHGDPRKNIFIYRIVEGRIVLEAVMEPEGSAPPGPATASDS